MSHIPVLLNEVIEYLDPRPGETVVDATVGGGGHMAVLCQKIVGRKGQGLLIGLDQDKEAIKAAEIKMQNAECRIVLIQGNFREMDKLLEEKGIKKADKILFDLGMSSDQVERSGRGFSFLHNEPLLMTFEERADYAGLTAYKIVNQWNEKDIADVLYKYGEERFSRRIAKNICQERKRAPIQTTGHLVEIIKKSVPGWYRYKKIHPATRTFQALRIAVNDELNALEEGLQKGWEILSPGGRIAVISFHSLEDRVVKKSFKSLAEKNEARLVNKKPITPAKGEIDLNPRSRSAKLRVIEKL